MLKCYCRTNHTDEWKKHRTEAVLCSDKHAGTETLFVWPHCGGRYDMAFVLLQFTNGKPRRQRRHNVTINTSIYDILLEFFCQIDINWSHTIAHNVRTRAHKCKPPPFPSCLPLSLPLSVCLPANRMLLMMLKFNYSTHWFCHRGCRRHQHRLGKRFRARCTEVK